ncbi:hypothetical protein [Sphingomonas panacisoli]|jgi:hypothetical protein|nr:hypothetical protein [Sphingomonas panacisoli]
MTPAAPPFLPDFLRIPPRPAKRPATTWWLDLPPGTDPKYRIN